jgi:hypothetical protein
MAKKAGNGTTRHAKIYKSYSFRTKDPVIDELRTIIQDEKGKLTNKVLRDIETDGGPSASAMHEWFYGKTLRPQNPAVEAAGRALRWYRSWKRMPSDMK